jgi:stress-induced morphogen
MYKIIIESAVFEGKPRVAQHQMVSECIKEELETIHAFNLKTSVPKKVE